MLQPGWMGPNQLCFHKAFLINSSPGFLVTLGFAAGKGIDVPSVQYCKLDCSQLQLLTLSGLGQENTLVFFIVFGAQFVAAG